VASPNGIRHDIGRDDAADRFEARQRVADRFPRRAEIDRALEAAQHRREPLGEIVGDAVEQERRRPQSGRAPAALPQQGAIENHGILGHDPVVTSVAMTTASRNGSVVACRT
jgi:hypothetical protein